MAPKRWEQINEIFHTALAKEPEQRGKYLEEACAEDSETRREVERLLTLHEHTADFLEKPAIEVAARALVEHETLDRIGPYRILKVLGEGGMGIVYLAEQEKPIRRKVALKVIKLGMDTKEVIARFESERQALALMNHPNIAMIYDAGTTPRGQPYFVMEYVPGISIHDYCDRNRLSTKERLELFTQVCGAIEHAHQKGILHRDLKPSNMLVETKDGKAVPKVIDFGLAKATSLRLTEKTYFTQHGALIGTPAYMSPEQAEMTGLDVGKTTDIYSLGVVLYQLLVGALPFDVRVLRQAGYDEMRRMIRETDPPIPSDKLRSLGDSAVEVARYHNADVTSLANELKGDLDWITAKAMEKAPMRRYPSAAEFASDISRHLREEPIAAGPVGIVYRIERFVRRKKNLIAAVATPMFILLAMGFLLLMYWPAAPGTDEIPSAAPRRITSTKAWEAHPALSPDGSRIAYTSNETGNLELYIAGISDGTSRRITTHEADDDYPAWFPDGESLAFTSDRSGESSIWKTNRSGDEYAQLILNAERPAVSPDGTRIAFSRKSLDGHYRVGVAELSDPSSTVMLTTRKDGVWNHLDPAWSPDGSKICYSSRHGLWIVPSSGGEASQLFSDGELDTEPVWSPDGRHIYFTSFRSGTLALWRIPAEGGTPERLTSGSGPESHASVSDSGIRLAHATGSKDYGYEQVIYNRETGMEFKLPEVYGDVMASFSPDTTQLVRAEKRSEPHGNLWVYDLENGIPQGTPTKLTDDVGIASHPDYSPDGEWIAYYRIIGKERDVWIIRATGGIPSRLTEHAAVDALPAWSPDNTKLAFISDRDGRDSIWIMNVEAGRRVGSPRKLTQSGLAEWFPTWSRDGDEIAFVGIEGYKSEVWIVPADGRSPARQITEGAQAFKVQWDLATNRLLVSGIWGSDRITLRSVSADGSVSEELAPPVVFGSKSAKGVFDASMDGRHLVYMRQALMGDIWVLEATEGIY